MSGTAVCWDKNFVSKSKVNIFNVLLFSGIEKKKKKKEDKDRNAG